MGDYVAYSVLRNRSADLRTGIIVEKAMQGQTMACKVVPDKTIRVNNSARATWRNPTTVALIH